MTLCADDAAGVLNVVGVENRDEVFRQLYDDAEAGWGGHSGGGSLPYWTIEYRAFLERFIFLNNINTIVDIGCGDWQFFRFINLTGVRYYGFDVVESVIQRNRDRYQSPSISFDVMPMDFDEVPSADLLIMKDVLQHLPNSEIIRHKEELFYRYPMCLITNSYRKIRSHNYDMERGDITVGHNYDIEIGQFRCLSLNEEPFNFGGTYVLEFSSPLFEQIRTLLYLPR